MSRFKLLFAGTLITVTSALGLLALPAVSYALPAAPLVGDITKTDACAGLTSLDASQDCDAGHGDTGVTQIIKTVVSILSIIVGVASVIVVIIAGLKYITSNGDSNGISSAKSTLTYALIGLAVAALAQVLVHYVLSQAAQAENTKTSSVIERRTDVSWFA